ncbi:Hypothetical predicted protein [Mytilus galloprovincialis]|uniref:B box-type domain-containing protein n=1 Tax=Mytilus galloprovincialis TaxID=29158 RepID=A0A8B6E3J3_MYTGA|nr:Hypothetical predicted protein [Mytilus galloprovincialis]
MASRAPSASTRKKAQVILSCQLCQRSSPLKWKCLDCDILMCDNCKINVHSKVKTIKIHKTVDIKDVDISQPKELSVDLDNYPCNTHPTQSCCVYCVQCKELICPKCLKTHKGHDVEEIETQYIQNLEYLRKNSSDYIDPHDLNTIFGSFDQLSIITNPEKINLKKTNTYETNLPFVHRLVTTSVNSIWITCYETTVSGLQEMQIAQELKAIREYNYRTIFDMTISKTGDLLLTLSEDSHLYRLDTTGKMNIVHDFSPLLPKAINVSDDSITVSTREKGPTFPLTVHSRRQVVILNQTGKKKVRVIENDKQKRRLFSFLSRITSDKLEI